MASAKAGGQDQGPQTFRTSGRIVSSPQSGAAKMTSDRHPERKLAAILAADVVGYSSLMGEDEAGTARAVREHREAATPIVRDLGGRLVKTMGDGVLLEFPSVVAAVECAIAIQKQMVERNAGVPEAKRILYRIGVNLGDVLIDGEDILGDGVNIAARLEGVAEPGGICLSGSAYDHVRGRIEADFVDLGREGAEKHRPAAAGLFDSTGRQKRAAFAEPGDTRKIPPAASLHRGAALRQYRRRPGPGLFRRGPYREPDDRPLAHFRLVRHRPQHRLHL